MDFNPDATLKSQQALFVYYLALVMMPESFWNCLHLKLGETMKNDIEKKLLIGFVEVKVFL